MVVKAGSGISKYGRLVGHNADYIEKHVYDELMPDHAKIEMGDVLLASTGTGTLGKACVYDRDTPAIAESHVTIIRVDASVVDPYYLADYLRRGLGRDQVERLYTGATGLIELPEDAVERIRVRLLDSTAEQKLRSKSLRDAEDSYLKSIVGAEQSLSTAVDTFASI
jgi:type I restriction enzyme M protein